MIRKSFIFLPRITEKGEQKIWGQGINSWQSFIDTKNVDGITRARKSFYDLKLEKAKKHLQLENSYYFYNNMPNVEAWRLYDCFKDDCCFLDIETVGYNGYITVIGLYDGKDTKIMVKDINLNMKVLKEELSKYKLLVTFNGSSFDLPCINRYYPNCIPDIAHIDLRHACRKVNLVGGLKSIEEQIGIFRPDHLKAVGGDQAIQLWRAYKASGDKEYLDLLVQYNEEDIINLKPLMEHVYGKLKTMVSSI
ncbi:MAG: ribonuclease H-like domain-containing protein [Candidatus Woesearchaeota archaeon]